MKRLFRGLEMTTGCERGERRGKELIQPLVSIKGDRAKLE